MKVLRDKWLAMTPGYDHPLYTDEDLREVIRTHLPQYLRAYDSFTQPIERVDFARIALLYVYGGVYADLDTEPLKPIDVWVDKNTIVLGREPLEHARTLYKREVVLCNAFMISPAKQQLFLDFLDYIVAHYEPYYKPVENTGPMAMTKFYEAHPNAFSSAIITNPCVFFPIIGDGTVSKECNINDAYVQHLWHNTWTTKGAGDWVKTYGRNVRLWTLILLALFIVLWIVLWVTRAR